MKYASLVGYSGFEGRPDDGAILKFGVGYQDWELTYAHFPSDYDRATLYYTVGSTAAKITITVPSLGAPYSSCELSNNVAALQCIADGTSITFLDPPGTTHELPPGQPQAQAAILSQLCAAQSRASCVFTSTSADYVYSPIHQVGNSIYNPGDRDQLMTVKTSDTVGSSDSLGGEVKGEVQFLEVAKAVISVKYEHEWTTEHKFEQDVDVTCGPRRRCWINATQPMVRYTGNYTLTMGNTTWTVRDVYFDQPNLFPNRQGEYTVCTDIDKVPECALPPPPSLPGVRVEKRRSDTYTVPSGPQYAKIAQLGIRLSTSAPASVLPGAVADYRVKLTSTQPAKGLAYPLENLRVVDSFAGDGPGRWLIRALLPGQSRTLDMAVRVPRDTHRYFCITVRAAAQHARATLARRCSSVMGGPTRVSGLG